MHRWKLFSLSLLALATMAATSRILVTSFKGGRRRLPQCRGSRRLEQFRGRCMSHYECVRQRGVTIGHCFAVPGLVAVGACCMLDQDPGTLVSAIVAAGGDQSSPSSPTTANHNEIQSKHHHHHHQQQQDHHHQQQQQQTIIEDEEEPLGTMASTIAVPGPKITTTPASLMMDSNGTIVSGTISSNQLNGGGGGSTREPKPEPQTSETDNSSSISSSNSTAGKTEEEKNPIKPAIIDFGVDRRPSPRPVVVNQNEFYEIVVPSFTTSTTTSSMSTTRTPETEKDHGHDDDDEQEKHALPVEPSTTTTSTTTMATTTLEPKRPRLCGVRPLRPTGRVVGGRNAQFGEWPWQVLIKESTWLGFVMKSKCGGVLIDYRWVLTAAHCQPGMMGSLIVTLGQYELHGASNSQMLRPQIKTVRRMIVHRDYDPDTFDNDIALLELDTPFEMQPHIVPICLPETDQDYVGRYAYVAGWGKLSYGGTVPTVLQTVRLPIIDNGRCQKMFTDAGHYKPIRERFLCAGYSQGGRDTCEGDSGGPLMMLDDQPATSGSGSGRHGPRWTLVATVSHGIKCAEPNLPGVYMKTWSYLPWIRNIIDNRNLF